MSGDRADRVLEVLEAATSWVMARKDVKARGNLASQQGKLLVLKRAEDRLMAAVEQME